MIEWMPATTKTLYDTDFVEWTARTAELLREGRFDEVDLEHLAEEVEGLGKSERSAVRSQLRRMLTHMIKQTIQPERDGPSWQGSIEGSRLELEDALKDSPSLRRYLTAGLQENYRKAVQLALTETGFKQRAKELDIPEQCPWTLADLLESDRPQKSEGVPDRR